MSKQRLIFFVFFLFFYFFLQKICINTLTYKVTYRNPHNTKGCINVKKNTIFKAYLCHFLRIKLDLVGFISAIVHPICLIFFMFERRLTKLTLDSNLDLYKYCLNMRRR